MHQRRRSDDTSPVPEFRSSRSGSVRGEADAQQRRVLLEALDGMSAVEDRMERVMTEILETGAFWRVHETGNPPRLHLVEIQLHGIGVMGGDVPQAIALWMAAARQPEEARCGDG